MLQCQEVDLQFLAYLKVNLISPGPALILSIPKKSSLGLAM